MANPLITSRIVWAALCFSTLLYGFVLFTTGRAVTFFVPSDYNTLEIVALCMSAVLLVTYHIHETRVKYVRQMEKRFSGYVICWALHESMVVVAFAAIMAGESGNIFLYVINLILALLGNIITRPKEYPKGM